MKKIIERFVNSLRPALERSNNYFNKLDEKLKGSKKIPPYLRKSKLLAGILGVCLLVLIVAFSSFSGSVGNIPTYMVKKDNFQVTVTESGEIEAKNSTSISAPRIRGNLKIVYLIPEGTRVQAGDTVARFDPTEAITNLRNAESQLEIAISDKKKLVAQQKADLAGLQSALKSAELQFELSKLNLEQIKFEAEIKQREEKLNHQKNELALEQAKQNLESKKIVQQSELAKSDVDVQQKKSDTESARRDLNMLTLTAPKAGLVVYQNNWATGRKFVIGDTPWPGQPVISLPDLSAMESKTFVNEVDVSRIKKGLHVGITLDAFQDSTFDGVISNVASLGTTKDRNSNIKVFEVFVDINSHSDILKPGMTTSNKIIINNIANVLFVPQEAVFEKDGREVVYLRNGSGFDEQPVEIGQKSNDYIVIKKGIKDGDLVALRDPNLKLDGTEASSSENKTANFPAR